MWGWHNGQAGVLLYIGITGRTPTQRLREHLDEQRWAGDVTAWEVDTRTYRTRAAAEAAERAAIRAECPVHNVAHNGGNPRRVPAVRHHRRPVRYRRPWWRRRWIVAAVAWLVLFVGLWMISAPHAPDAGTGALAGLFGSSLAVGYAVRPRRRRRRRR